MAAEEAWGDSVVAVHGGLTAGRRFVWEEASRKVSPTVQPLNTSWEQRLT